MNEPKSSRWVAVYSAYIAARISRSVLPPGCWPQPTFMNLMKEAAELADREEETRLRENLP